MRERSGNSRAVARRSESAAISPRLPLALFAAALCLAAAPAPSSLRFEQVFTTTREPAFLHYTVQFNTGGRAHRMEVWRDHERRLKRETDHAIVTFAARAPGGVDYSMTVLDTARRISTRIDRVNLYRIGQFADWFDLVHGLRRPKGKYRLVPASRPANAEQPPFRCRWYDLAEGYRTTSICWDDQHGIPLLIGPDHGPMAWRVLSIDTAPIASTVFVIRDEGYTRTDANRDVEQD